MSHTTFITTTRGLKRETPPMRLYEKADAFDSYDSMPFGLVEDDFVDYATGQFQKRIERLEKARGARLEDVYRVTNAVIERGDE